MSEAHILVVDDQADVRAEVKERIESLGYDSDEASCQEDALRKVKEIRYDCVLLDLGIPVKLEGVARVEYGKHLLQQIVTLPDAPPVIIITSNGLDGHQLAVEMMEIGAESFVAKPFKAGLLESKIQKVLGERKGKPGAQARSLKLFAGGALVMNEDGIELCDISVGGGRANAIIRGVVEHLAIRKNDKFLKASAKTLSDAIKNAPSAPTLTAAINDFRNLCVNKLREAGIESGKDAVIFTAKGGGYQFREWIDVRVGREGELITEAEKDCAQVMRAFRRNCKFTVQQVRDAVALSPIRIKTAMAKLEECGKIKNVGGSGKMTTYEVKAK